MTGSVWPVGGPDALPAKRNRDVEVLIRLRPKALSVKAGTITSILAGMATGADCIDDLNAIRCGGIARLFAGCMRAGHAGSDVAGVHPRLRPAD